MLSDRLRPFSRVLVMSMCVAATLLFGASASASTSFAEGDEPIVPTDLFRLRNITSIDVDRNGFKAVFAVQSMEPKSKGEVDGEGPLPRYVYRSHLFAVDLTDRRAVPFQLTTGDRRDSSPVISPDGAFVAFVRSGESTDGDGPSAQVWVLPMNGGEAWQISDLEHGASQPQWSPDGRRLLVMSSLPTSEIEGTPPWPSERPNATVAAVGDDIVADPDGDIDSVRAWLAANSDEYDPYLINDLQFQGEQSLRKERRIRHAFVIEFTDTRAPIEATQVTSGFFGCQSPTFSVTGDQLIFAGSRDASQAPDRIRESQIWQIDIDGTNVQQLVAIPGMRLSQPQLNSAGAYLGFVGQQLDEPTYRQRRLGVMALTDAGNGNESDVAWFTEEDRPGKDVDGSVSSFRWLPTRMGLVYRTARRGGFPLMTITASLVEPAEFIARPLDNAEGELPIGVGAFDLGGAATVYAQTSVTNPCTLRVRDALGDREIMDLNPWVNDKALSMPRPGILSRPDGTEIEYWLMPPTVFDESKQYPLALEIHGGPSAMWGPGERSMWFEFQLLASRGFAVVYANPRGSGGYGYEFQKGNHQNWGQGPGGDVLAAVDAALLEPWIDPDRLVVTGGSYGGYLTAWIVSQDHRFKAAVAQRGVYDLATFFGEGNAFMLVEHAMGGMPWDARVRDVLRRESPFTYVNRIRTPMLIMHGSQDLRTGVSQSEMMYRALKKLEKPVEYIRYPETGHDLSRSGQPNRRLDRLMRIVEFFERFVGDDVE